MRVLRFLTFLLTFSSISAGAASFAYSDLFNPSDTFAPYPFIYFDCNHPGQYILLVEKRSQSLLVLGVADSILSLEKSYICSTGKMLGDKEVAGDLKTPEGIYFIRGEKDPQELSSIYGAGAWVLDYPNGFDKLKKKNGYGIWIHGTDEPERIQNSNDTKGCVVLNNSDFLDLEAYIKVDQTPVIIVDELLYRNQEYLQSDKKEVETFIKTWQQGWQNKDIDSFIDCYSSDFVYEDMNYYAFRSYKKRLFKQYESINLELSNIQVFRKGLNYVVNFYQNYSTENYSDFGIKQLYIVKKNNTFKIIKEIWSQADNFIEP